MRSELEIAVILPDGNLEFGQSHLVNDDVQLVPLHPEVDLRDVLHPKFDGSLREFHLRTLTHDRIDEILGFGERHGIVVGRDQVARGYGNKPGGTEGYETIRDAIRDGQVIVFDGLPWYPVVSENGSFQDRYRIARREGYSHRNAVLVAKHGEIEAIINSADMQALVTAIKGLDGNEFESVRSMSLPQYRQYRDMRSAGESHNMAEILATRTFPGVKTDAIFNEGKFSGESGRIGVEQTWLRKQAEDAGVSTNGKWYCRGLASFPGDPTAWISDRSDVLRVAREKNMTVHGYVEHAGHEADPGEDLSIANEIIDDEVSDILDSNPHADAEAVREQVYRLRTGAVDPNPLVVQESNDELPCD